MFFGAYNSLLVHASMPEKTLENPVFMLQVCIHDRSCTRRQVHACRFVDHLVYTYTHIHIRTQIHSYTYTRTHERTHTYAHTYAHTYMHTLTNARSHSHTHTYTNVNILLMWISRRCLLHKCVCMGERESVYVCVCVRAWVCVYMHVRSYVCVRVRENACKRMHSRSRASMGARAHTRKLFLSRSIFFMQHTHVHTHLFSSFSLPFARSLFSRSLLSRSLCLSCSLARSLALSLPPL